MSNRKVFYTFFAFFMLFNCVALKASTVDITGPLLNKVKTTLLTSTWLKIKDNGHIGKHFAATAGAVEKGHVLPGYDTRPEGSTFEDRYNTKESMLALVKEVINSPEFRAKGDLIQIGTQKTASDFKKILIYGKGSDGKEYSFLFHKGFGIETGYPNPLSVFEKQTIQ